MKVIIEEDENTKEIEIIIRCAKINPTITKFIDSIQSNHYTLKGKKQNQIYAIPIEDVHYMESVDDQTFIYTKDEVYECELKLYELEEQLQYTHCVRISKSCIVNCDCLLHVKPLFDGKFEATTFRGELVTINRHYVKKFKEVFGL